ncbi:MAG: radical SAM protein, partial [Planctomycetota bacterium]|nr:radical SAM protein [Planctomycetota bacterium]
MNAGRHEAAFWKPADGRAVDCFLCGHRCRIAPGKRGVCRVRENAGGRLETLVYGRLIAAHVDPIEKKPLHHFLPG